MQNLGVTVNSEWLERHMELFRYSAHTQSGKLNVEIAHLYGLLGDIDYLNPQKDTTEPSPVYEPMGCSKTLEDPKLEQRESDERDARRNFLRNAGVWCP